MTQLIFGEDEALARWAASRIPHVGEAGFGPCKAIGMMGPNDEALGVIVYHDYQRRTGTLQISMAAESPRWATKGTIRALLSVPFLQYKVNKVWVAIPTDNERAIRFCRGIGLKSEATLREHFGRKRHAVILSMLLNEFQNRWAVRH